MTAGTLVCSCSCHASRYCSACACHTDNDDGITVIDVTDPDAPAHCFLFPQSLPLDGPGYLAHYKGDLEESPDVLGPIYERAAKELEDVPLVTFDALAEAWPRSYVNHWRGSKRKLKRDSEDDAGGDKKRRTETDSIHVSNEEASTALVDDDSHSRGLPSLTSMALREAVTQSLKTGETGDIEGRLWLPGQIDIIREMVHEKLQGPAPDSALAVPLMKKLVEHDVERAQGALDLAGLRISDDLLRQVTHNVLALTSLNLSQNSIVTTSAVEQMLATLPNLRRLLMINCPSVESKSLGALFDTNPRLFHRLETFVHPLFMVLSDKARWHPAITFVAPEQRLWYSGVSLPFFSPAAVVQGLDDLFTAIPRASGGAGSVGYNLPGALTVAFTASRRVPRERSWYERSIIAAPILNQHYMDPRSGDWIFVLDVPSIWSSNMCGWGFIRLLPSVSAESSADAGERPAVDETTSDTGTKVASLEQAEAEEETRPSSHSKKSENANKAQHKLDFEVCDLRTFLAHVIEEGRPPVSEEAVRHAEETMSGVCDSFKLEYTTWTDIYKCPLMTRSVAACHLKKIFADYSIEGAELTEEDKEVRKAVKVQKPVP